MASHSFPTDVPDSHQFHNEIGIFKATNITVGCSATAFCPQSAVLRQAMAAFVVRALGLVVRPGESTQRGVSGSRVAMVDDDQSFVGTVTTSSGRPALALRGPNTNVVAGAEGNYVGSNSTAATVGGGVSNRALSDQSVVAGGFNNAAGGSNSAVGGGFGNSAAGWATAVPGGGNNTAGGAYSFAAGRRAKANHDGSFVWADSNDVDFPTGGPNSFIVRSTGGADFITGIDLAGNSTAGVYVSAGSGTWVSVSDRKAKRGFSPVDGGEILRRLARVPITTWSYRAQPGSVRHIGPTAQDFKRAFGVGEDERGIATVDADGVALAAVKELHRRLERLERRNAALERSLARLTREEK